MTTPTPTGIYSEPLSNLRKLVSKSATLQSLYEVETAGELEELIFLLGDDRSEADLSLPRVVIGLSDEMDFSQKSTTGWQSTGPITLIIELETPEEYRGSYQSAGLDFLNKIGAIVGELKAWRLANPSSFNATRFGWNWYGQAEPCDENGLHYWGINMSVSWSGM